MLSQKTDLIRPAWARYGLAVGCVFLAWLGREALTPSVGPSAIPYILFFPAIALSSWYGGFGPGALAALLSGALADWFFIPPTRSLGISSSGEVVAWVVFLAAGLFIAFAMEVMHRARAKEARQNCLIALTLASIGDAVITTDETGK